MLCLKYTGCLLNQSSRFVSTSSVLWDIKYRLRNQLPLNPNRSNAFLDGPDFTYLDSNKPAPMNKGQMVRLMEQQKLASTVLSLNSEIEFALNAEKQHLLEEAASKKKILDRKLKAKGSDVKSKS